MEVEALAAAIDVRLVRRFQFGEGAGAYEVRLADGSPAVLKFGQGEPPNDVLLGALRERGYPIPVVLRAGLVEGTDFELTELVEGEPLGHVTASQLPQVLQLNDLQRSAHPASTDRWVTEMIASTTEGCTGYCELPPLRAHDSALLDRLQSIARASTGLTVATNDIVHYDFSPLNLLANGGRITGVIDWQGARGGDATFDLVTLAFFTWDPAQHEALLAAARVRTDPAALPLYVAHMALRQIDWSLRHHDAEHVQWNVNVSNTLLAAVT